MYIAAHYTNYQTQFEPVIKAQMKDCTYQWIQKISTFVLDLPPNNNSSGYFLFLLP